MKKKTTLSDSLRFFEKLCVNDTMSEDLSKTCLFYSSPEELIGESMKSWSVYGQPLEKQEEFELSNDLGTYAFWPMIDDLSDNPFLPEHPITILNNQRQKMVPFMSGVTKDEGAMVIARLWKYMDPSDNKLQENWGYIGAKNLFFKQADAMDFDWKLKARMVAHFYVGENGITRENKQGLMDMFTDSYFAHPNTEAIKMHAKSPVPTYNYLFSYRGSFSLAPMMSGFEPEALKEDFGVCHGDDLLYMFKSSLQGNSSIPANDKKMVEIYQKLITNFARYGNPTPLASADIPIWLPAQKSKAACVYMDINLKPQEKHRIFAERMAFWNLIDFKERFERHAVDEDEEDLLDEIETTISEVEDEDNHVHHKKKHAVKKPWKKNKKGNRGKWRKLKGKKLAKRKRLAKRLRNIQCP